ncbi:AcrR family transcriptional regulator [Kineosphaera limosa]|uniref:TetR family transcriptional regulator n=1 Tax=Kineosphaera limosa NBRC 100340 TaxID=1184609 RepID=K6WQL4_9MICO|nr:hypothetical protein [Kineosphaera limosa]NYE01905.1 AcrR family transcriptional regulator [Kineosphaera limosa]GAB96131.1 hypothetical protein KILIM_032_00160 [Kineosphaera limosa NBRC 100340]
MSRVSGRDPELVQQVLADVVWRHAKRQVADERAAGLPWLDVRVSDIVDEANERLRTLGQPAITVSFITKHYGTKDEFLDLAIASYLGPSVTDAQALVDEMEVSLAAGQAPREVRRQAAERDLEGMVTGDAPWTRIWLAMHSSSARQDIRAVLGRVYDEFDRVMIPLYEKELASRGRVMRHGLSTIDLAAAFTALTEGLAMRTLSHEDLDHSQARRLTALVSEEILVAFSEPASGQVPVS